MKTIQQNLKSNNLSLNEAIDVAQNHPLYIWRYSLLMLHARNGCMNELTSSQFTAGISSTEKFKGNLPVALLDTSNHLPTNT